MKLPELPVRPDATTYSVEDILFKALAGELRIPPFQTGLRWGPKHVAELFDSIVRGFPIGGLLLWKRAADAETLHIGPVAIDAPARPDALFVVDGQQRITSLVGALLHPDEQPLGGTHALWVDLSTREFRVLRDLPGAPWIPVNTLGHRVRLQQWARHANFGEATDALVQRAFEIETALIRYQMPGYIVQSEDEGVLRLIFSRINDAGEPLSEDQVFQALFGGDSAAPKPLDAMATWLAGQTLFGELPSRWLLRCVKAVGEVPPMARFTETHPPASDLIERTRDAMRRAILFLQHDTGFLHASVLPYRFPLIILARFFDLHPDPHPRSRVLLTRWVWRGAVSGLHSASSHATVAAHLGDIGDDEHGSVQRLLRRTPSHDLDLPDPMADWAGRSAATRLYATSMIHRPALDPETETEWEPEALLQCLSSRALGDAFRPALPGKPSPVAARVLLPAGTPTRRLVDASDEVLDGLSIERQAAAALRRGDRDAFTRHRAVTLERDLGRLVALKAAPGESDRGPLSVIRAGG